ncbi:sensor domain-containing diguanylate cyclase [Sporosarcina sp. OR05]|uniref:sensor domain-containing diguanylate cyclase n=1 Tax=Sporosarcina sp. OR05 TaxID=2969819 RepID=UPI00352AB49F
MDNQELLVFEMKSAIFNLFSKRNSKRPLEENLTNFKLIFMNLFDIEFADILLYDNNRYIPIVKEGKTLERSWKSGEPQVKIEHPLLLASFISTVESNGYEFADDSLIIRDDHQSPLGALLFKASEKWHDFAATPYLKDLKTVFGTYLDQSIRMYQITEKEMTYRRLFEIAELFNSTMESAVILNGMMEAIQDSFPLFDVQLLLSQEQKGTMKTYRLFDYLNERASAVDAFLSGDLTIENVKDQSVSLVNAPIRGRQGIYGVVQISAPNDAEFTETEKGFVRMITNAAGTALENASLYEQSHRLVNDLQLVNEASRKLNSNLDLVEMIAYLKGQFITAFQPTEIAFVLRDDSGNWNISASSTDFFTKEVAKQYIEMVVQRLSSGEEAIFDPNAPQSSTTNIVFKSQVALPIIDRDEMIGFVILLHEEEYFFSFDSFKLMRSLISHSSLAISNILLRDQLQELVNKDNLTKLYTRRYLDNEVATTINNKGEDCVFLLMDVDDFKQVNDTYGHTTGDDVLQQISTYILTAIDGLGIACRWGGEEIAIFLPSASVHDGVQFAQMLVSYIPTVTTPQVTVSIGMSTWSSKEGKSYNELFQSSDKALYYAKNNGKNQFVMEGVASAK